MQLSGHDQHDQLVYRLNSAISKSHAANWRHEREQTAMTILFDCCYELIWVNELS